MDKSHKWDYIYRVVSAKGADMEIEGLFLRLFAWLISKIEIQSMLNFHIFQFNLFIKTNLLFIKTNLI